MQTPQQDPPRTQTPRLQVAAIIPLYNGEGFIREALASILAQTVPVEDIIVVDDGSTDDGVAVVEAVMREHPAAPIRVLRKPNGGQSSARNFGMASTDCELIAPARHSGFSSHNARVQSVAGPLDEGNYCSLCRTCIGSP